MSRTDRAVFYAHPEPPTHLFSHSLDVGVRSVRWWGVGLLRSEVYSRCLGLLYRNIFSSQLYVVHVRGHYYVFTNRPVYVLSLQSFSCVIDVILANILEIDIFLLISQRDHITFSTVRAEHCYFKNFKNW